VPNHRFSLELIERYRNISIVLGYFNADIPVWTEFPLMSGSGDNAFHAPTFYCMMIQFRYQRTIQRDCAMNLAFSLYRLQTLDTQRQKISGRLTQIDATLAADEVIRACQEAKAAAEQSVRQAQSQVNDLANQSATKRIKLELNQNQLFGGKVRNPKDLQDLQAEAEFLRHTLQKLDDQQIESMLQLEAAQQVLQEAELAYQRCLSDKARESSLLLGEKHQLENELSGLDAQRQTLVQTLPADVVAHYETLLKTKAGKAVAAIIDETCEACGMTITPSDMQSARSPNVEVHCRTCGRILYKA
jgi:predicted  nucleic acid-binding Zn-ribbon protein